MASSLASLLFIVSPESLRQSHALNVDIHCAYFLISDLEHVFFDCGLYIPGKLRYLDAVVGYYKHIECYLFFIFRDFYPFGKSVLAFAVKERDRYKLRWFTPGTLRAALTAVIAMISSEILFNACFSDIVSPH